MKFTESCIIEQHIDRLLKSVEPTNLGLCTPDAAALIVRIVRGWANDLTGSTQTGTGCRCRATNRLGKRLWEGFSFNMLGSREGRLPTASRDLRSSMGTV